MAKPQIFISHISKETELAQTLKKHLAKDYLLNPDEIFVSSDGKSIEAGEEWLKELREALQDAPIVIILCSKESVGRPWVNFEAGAGWILKRRIIPLCHSGMKRDDLPTPLNTLQALEVNQAASVQILYETIGGLIKRPTPPADFNAIAAEIKDVETRYLKAVRDVEKIENPRILCGASENYAEAKYGFDKDVLLLEKTFPGVVTVERKLTAKQLRRLLTSQRFDIIHLVLEVDSLSGDLLFTPVNETVDKTDKMSAEGFAKLVVESQTGLIVLATCHALSLAVEVANITNMVGTNIDLTVDQAIEWGECFYDLLANGTPLYKAFDITKENVNVPLRLIRHRNVVFTVGT